MSKIRLDYVTNSSSSSFICVKVNGRELEKEILKQNGIDFDNISDLWEENNYGDFELKGGLTCVIGEGGYVSYVGADISCKLYDTTVNQHKEKLVKTLKDTYDIKVSTSDIKFDFGEIYQ